MSATWTVVMDDEGAPHTKCGGCGHLDAIYEVDVATRGNTLHLSPDGKSATASCGDDDWEREGWACGACGYPDLEAPEDFEITDWY